MIIDVKLKSHQVLVSSADLHKNSMILQTQDLAMTMAIQQNLRNLCTSAWLTGTYAVLTLVSLHNLVIL